MTLGKDVKTTYLQEFRSFAPHTRVKISLATLDMIMKISSKLMDQVYCVLTICRVRVSRKQHKCHVSENIQFTCYISENIRFKCYISENIQFTCYISENIRFTCYMSENIRFTCYRSENITLNKVQIMLCI